MKKLILTASVIALIPAAAHAQLLGGGLGGSLGGSLGGTIDNTIGSSIGNVPVNDTIDRTTRTVRSTVDGTAATDGDQSVDARNGTVSANRSANGSITGSTASLANLPVPALGGMANGSASGQANGSGNANAQLIGTDAVAGALAPVSDRGQTIAGNAAGRIASTATGVANSAPMPGLPATPALAGLPSVPATPGLPALGGANADANGEGSAEGNGSASLISSPLAVAGSAASAGQGAASVFPGMPVMTPEGASLGQVREIVANGRGEVEQVVVQQGDVTRALPAGMFSASGNALVAGQAQGEAGSEPEAPSEDTQ